jgi:hypothetical protein
MPGPSHSSWFDHQNNIWWGIQITKLLVVYFSPLSCYLSLSGQNTALSTLFPNTLSLRSSSMWATHKYRCGSQKGNSKTGNLWSSWRHGNAEIRNIKEIKGKTENWIKEKPGNRCKQVNRHLMFGSLGLVLETDSAVDEWHAYYWNYALHWWVAVSVL